MNLCSNARFQQNQNKGHEIHSLYTTHFVSNNVEKQGSSSVSSPMLYQLIDFDKQITQTDCLMAELTAWLSV